MEQAEHVKVRLQRRIETEIQALRDFRSSGGKVLGSLCHAFPQALGAGLGMWPVRVLQGATNENEEAGERFMRPDSCPLVRAFIGAVAKREGLHGEIDAWVGMYTCDQTRRLFQELGRTTGARAFHLQLPSTRTPEAEDFFSEQIERLCRDLVSQGLSAGYSPDAAMVYENARRRATSALRSITIRGLLPPTALHSMFGLLHIACPEGLADFFAQTATESESPGKRIRIAVAGGPMALEDTAVPELLEEAGAVMIPLGCSGLQASLPDGEAASGAPGDLAREYFRSSKCARCRPNDSVFDYLSGMIEETGCRGLILKTLKFCDLWFTERERIRERMPVPVLVLDTSFAPGGRERLGTRIEAFLESLS